MSGTEIFIIAFLGSFMGMAFYAGLQRLGGWLYDVTHPREP